MLTREFGKGFDASNLRHMRLFYKTFQIRDALRHELSWTHYRNLSRVENSVLHESAQLFASKYRLILPSEEELRREIERERAWKRPKAMPHKIFRKQKA